MWTEKIKTLESENKQLQAEQSEDDVRSQDLQDMDKANNHSNDELIEFLEGR